MWTLKTTYYWTQVFPAGQELRVSHNYTPSVGAAAQTMVGSQYSEPSMMAAYRRRFCIDDRFERAAKRAHKRGKKQRILSESNLEYVLKTGANWAGSIKRFRLVVDKGAPENLVSFCMKNVRKISETRFESVQRDFWPDRDLEILILKPHNLD